MEINFSTSVTNCAVMFDVNGNYTIQNQNMWIHGNNWNGQVAFPNGITWGRVNTSGRLNKMVEIPNSVTNATYMFHVCHNLNQNIQIPNSVTNAVSMFNGCSNLNQSIQIPNSVTNAAYMFNGCYSLNQNIQIPNSVTHAAYIFSGCSNLNQNIQIPNSVTTATSMFNSCSRLNQNIQIPNSVTSTTSMFYSCSNLNQNIQIPNSVTNAWFMFRKCNNIYDITIGSDIANNRFVGIFEQNNAHAKNIHTDASSAANLITTNIIANAGTNAKIAAQICPEWTAITNGYYNALYNVYIYTNAVFS